MKVRMRTQYCGVNGKAKPGAIVDVPEKEANQLCGIGAGPKDASGQFTDTHEFAVPFDEKLHGHLPVALRVAEKIQQQPPVAEVAAIAESETASFGHGGRKHRG